MPVKLDRDLDTGFNAALFRYAARFAATIELVSFCARRSCAMIETAGTETAVFRRHLYRSASRKDRRDGQRFSYRRSTDGSMMLQSGESEAQTTAWFRESAGLVCITMKPRRVRNARGRRQKRPRLLRPTQAAEEAFEWGLDQAPPAVRRP